MNKKAVFLGLVEMGALIGYIFAAILFGIFLFGVKGCTVVAAPSIMQNISGVDLGVVRADYEIVSMLRMPAAGDMNTADRIVWSIVNDDYLLLENQMAALYGTSEDYWKLEIYDHEDDMVKELEREDWEPKKDTLYEASSVIIPVHYHEDIPFINITFTITEGEKD